MPTTISKADWYRSQILGHEEDVATALKHGNADRAAFFKREITITKMLLDATLDYGVGFGGTSAAVNRTVAKLKAQEAQLNGIMKSALGPAYYDAVQKGQRDIAKSSNRRDPVDLAADLIAKLKRVPAEARAAGDAAREKVLKADRAIQKDLREAAKIRSLLIKDAALRKSAGWRILPSVDKRRVVDAAYAARKHLANIEARLPTRDHAKLAAQASSRRTPAKARAAVADRPRRAEVAKSKPQSEASRLRVLLGRAALLQKTAAWKALATSDRQRVLESERTAQKRLTTIERPQKAKQAEAKHQHAMVTRGVTFNRMSQH